MHDHGDWFRNRSYEQALAHVRALIRENGLKFQDVFPEQAAHLENLERHAYPPPIPDCMRVETEGEVR